MDTAVDDSLIPVRAQGANSLWIHLESNRVLEPRRLESEIQAAGPRVQADDLAHSFLLPKRCSGVQ